MAKQEQTVSQLQLLKGDIKAKRLKNLYIFHGEETFLLHYYLEAVKKLLVDPLTESFNFHKLTTESFTVQAFADGVENLPMMAEHTFVWVDDVDFFAMPEEEREKISQILADIPEYCTVVCSYIATAWKPDKRQAKLWDVIREKATVVSFDKQEQRDLVAWITRHFAAEKKRITPELCVYLIDITGGTMTALAGEISKICAFSGSEQIVKSDIDAVVEPVLDAVIFQMTDAMSRAEYGRALQKLHQLLKMQEEPLKILGAIGSHFRRLAIAKTLLENGRSSSDLMRLCAMKDYPARKTMSAAGGFSASFLSAAANLILETDMAMKSTAQDHQRLLEVLILRLAQEAKNG